VSEFDVPSRLILWIRAHGRFVTVMAAVLVLLGVVNVTRMYGPAGTGLVLGPVAALLLVVLSRCGGLSWSDLGLSRRTWARGALFALGAIAAVVALYVAAAVLPVTRVAFQDVRYELPPGQALFTALVVIPVGTVLVEEIAFRGVILGLVTRHHNVRWGLAISSALFGAWHILPSLGLSHVNAAVGGVAGAGLPAEVGVVAVAVAFTAGAGLLLAELRRRSGSVLAAAGLHWAVNGVGVLVAAVLYRLTTS
jgi:membrane protease YdiL (CAAX protease family)